MKKITRTMTALLLITLILFSAAAAEQKLNVVTTIFPVHDWVREVVGENTDHVELTMLLDSGVDLHSYQPSVQDIVRVTTADVFVYVGGESDEWIKGALAEAVNKELTAVNLVEIMGEDIKTEEIVEGMEHDHDHDHEEDHDREEDHDHGEEADEHVWLSLRNAQKLVKAIADVLASKDAAHADSYRANAAAYTQKLAALDEEYKAVTGSAAYRTVLFGDRFPFRYLVDDYGLDYYAAFSGCSAETEASFQTIVFLAGKVDELGLPAVLTIENPQTRIAETIVGNTKEKNQKVLSLDSMQGTTEKDLQAGTTYLGIMESNLDVLKEALN
ncbi:MAG: zinc ABC transporter substrate-binding protein [Clostridia bacterium]|nr:zinc ABC transporter substrate-binding protein [Clostridia bacterium]